MNKVVAGDLNNDQIYEALVLARSCLQDPASWDGYLRQAAASLMLTFLYGERSVGSISILWSFHPGCSSRRQLESKQDPRINFINVFNEQLTISTAPGAHWASH